jgi:hypothetical protein
MSGDVDAVQDNPLAADGLEEGAELEGCAFCALGIVQVDLARQVSW